MRVLDADTSNPVRVAQLYLAEREARALRAALDELLANPEASEHRHVFSTDMGAELSLSIVTPAKLEAGVYTPAERALLK